MANNLILAISFGFKLNSNLNRPFAAGGHMVQNPKYWRAKECAILQNKTQVTRKCDFSVFTFPSGLLSHSFALQYFGFCTM